MSNREQLTPAGAEIVEALTEFYETLTQGPDAVAQRFTVRTVELDLKPRTYTGEEVKKVRDLLGLSSRPRRGRTDPPGATPREPKRPHARALKGRHSGRPLAGLSRPFRALLVVVGAIPGRCPGLMCLGPFGARIRRQCPHPTRSLSLVQGFISDGHRNLDPGSGGGANRRKERTMKDLQSRVLSGLGADWDSTRSPWDRLMRLYEADREAFYLLACDGISDDGDELSEPLADLAQEVRSAVRDTYRIEQPTGSDEAIIKTRSGASLSVPGPLVARVKQFLLEIDGKGSSDRTGKVYEGRPVSEAEVRFKLGEPWGWEVS